MVDQNILQDHAFLGKTAFECRGKTTLISKDEDDIATPCLRFGQDRLLSTADGHQLAHRFATTGLPDSDSPLLADSGSSIIHSLPDRIAHLEIFVCGLGG